MNKPQIQPPPATAVGTPYIVPTGGLALSVVLGVTALAAASMPLALLAFTVWYMQQVMMQGWELWLTVVDFWSLAWSDLARLTGIGVQALFALLLLRQLAVPPKRDHAWLPVLPLDQPIFHQLSSRVAASLRIRPPKVIAVDATAGIEAKTDNVFLTLLGRGLRVKVGMSLVVGLTERQLAGLMAHEMAFYKGFHGATSGRIIRGVENWFRRRRREDPWNDRLWEEVAWGGRLRRLLMWCIWGASTLASLPRKLCDWLAQLISAPGMRMQVEFADRCGAALAGSDAYAEAISMQGRLNLAWQSLEDDLIVHPEAEELPDNLPLLLARQLLTDEVPELGQTTRTHRVWQALPDRQRADLVRSWAMAGAWQCENSKEAPAVFKDFHEQARRATMFFYQNDLHLLIPHLRFVTVEETIYDRRRATGGLEEPKRYFKGLAHPDRSCCGIAESLCAGGETDVLKLELVDCRHYINQHCHQMTALLNDWAKTWRMVRELESAHTLKKAGLHVHRHQFAAFTVADLQEDIERQRAIMDSLESQLRSFEGKLETRMACCLELLSREDPKTLPPKLKRVRATLPHWVLIYEALGLNLPIFRELLTSFGAFQALGATVTGRIESASYVTTVQMIIPRVIMLMQNLVASLSQYPYPFVNRKSAREERLTLDGYLSVDLKELFTLFPPEGSLMLPTGGDRRLLIHERARRLVAIVAPFMDRYIQLYHQSFAWVTRAMQMAEWHFADPMQGAVTETGVDDEREAMQERETYDPSWLTSTVPVPDPETNGRRTTLLLAR
ncbi:MAG: M48 family metalloprotease [Verrucomicrobiaceae bacterium]|nr:M48 family metalloprotease [Verrucomicrobiaceae bacterium]